MLALSDDSALIIQLVSSLVFGGICATIAAGRGRSAVGWFFIGMLTNCIGLVLVLVLPDLKQQDHRLRRQEMENRRLREQLAKERQVADQRHGQVTRRLGAHDQALDLDTSHPAELGGAAPPALPLGATWFYAVGTERLGPVSAETIRHLLLTRTISAQTLVWCDGMPNWSPLASVPALAPEAGGGPA